MNDWDWNLIGSIAFLVFCAIGLVVVSGEMLAAMLSRDGVMEGKDDLQPMRVAEPLAMEGYVAPELRLPPYTGVEDEGYTEPIRRWEQPSGSTYVSRSRLP